MLTDITFDIQSILPLTSGKIYLLALEVSIRRSKMKQSKLLEAIHIIEDAGLSVYRGRRKERGFMKVYSEPLNKLLPRISPSAFKVFAALANQVGYENTIVEISKAELIEITGMAEKTVRESLNELEDLGVMKRIGPPNRRKYVLNEMYVKKGK